jgi:hypothetical protein
MVRMRETRATAEGLRGAIERSGYYPDLVFDAVTWSLGAETAQSYVVHHEATFDPAMEVRRHLTVLVLTPTRLLVCHTDEHPPGETIPHPHASTSTESVPIGGVHSVNLTRVVADPEKYVPGMAPAEVVLTLGWGAVSHVDLEPATCGDESCEADHGFTGVVSGDDIALRVSAAADGQATVDDVVAFTRAISMATASAGGGRR